MNYPDAWGLKYTEVLSLAWLAYKKNTPFGSYYFPSSRTNWSIIRRIEVGPFHAVLATGSKKVLAFSGTSDDIDKMQYLSLNPLQPLSFLNDPRAGDWNDNFEQGLTGVSKQYLEALIFAKTLAPDVVVGHSLGGGLASYCAIYAGKHAATINPAPLNVNLLSGIGMLINKGLVINYVAPGEIMDLTDLALSSQTHLS